MGEFDAIGDYFSSDYVAHITGRDMKGGHKIVRGVISSLRKSFPDIHAEVEILLEGDDRISWQRTLQGDVRQKPLQLP